MPIEVEYWQSENDDCPVLEFIKKEPLEAQEKIEFYIGRLERFGLSLLKTEMVKKLKGYDMFELRIKVKRVLYRILFVTRGSKAILLEIFTKQSKKTPQRFINTAIGRVRATH